MADPTNYQRITLKMSTYYARTAAQKVWSLKFNLSGDTPLDYADFLTTADDLWRPVQRFTTGATSFIGALYYEIGSNVNTWAVDYPLDSSVGNTEAYSASGTDSQLEVVVICRAKCGTSSLGRSKYLMKHIHDVQQGSSPGVVAPLEATATVLAEWITGAGPDSLVPVDPIGGAVGTPWEIDHALYTRQLRRGERPPA